MQNAIAREVRHEIVTLPYYKVFDNITFSVNGSVVTLLGQVTSQRLKTDAEKAVKQIEGVRSVVNQIEVLPPSASDDKLRLAVYAATYGQMLLSQYAVQAVAPVHIIVKNGNVTLEGAVSSDMARTQFITAASGQSGIVSVTDHLKVLPIIPM